jgi:hypothetical protein
VVVANPIRRQCNKELGSSSSKAVKTCFPFFLLLIDL